MTPLMIANTVYLLPLALIILVIAAMYHFRTRISEEPKTSVPSSTQQTIEEIKKLYADRHEHRPATDADFIDRDRAWYESTTEELVALGFRSLGDRVNQTVERASGVVVVTRRFLSADHTTMTGIYQFIRPNKKTGAVIDLRVCDFESELSDGNFLTTSNTAGSNLASLPGQIWSTKHPADTSPAELARLHEAERKTTLRDKPGTHFIEIRNLEEYDESQQRQQTIKAAFRQGIGYVDPAEIRRIADQKWPDNPAKAAMVAGKFNAAAKRANADDSVNPGREKQE